MGNLCNKELGILHWIATKSFVSQREISKVSGVSLGLINVIIKKLIRDGYIKVSQPNGRKLQYHLTPQGELETAKETHSHAVNTIRNYKHVESNIRELLKKLYESGYNYFSIHGDGDLKELVESILYKCLEEAPVTLGQEHRQDPRAVMLKITTDPIDPAFKGDVVNVLEKIGE